MNTFTLPAFSALTRAASHLRAGELIAFPTETVYGLGADARSDAGIAKIYEAKGRPSGNPIIVHVPDFTAALQCTANPEPRSPPFSTAGPIDSHAAETAHSPLWPARFEKLAQQFWPGPLTLIVPRGPAISPLVSAGRNTVALRAPAHPVAQALLKEFAAPIAAPSANRSGFTSPTTAQHVLAELSGRIPLILDGGPCDIGLESTVLDITADTPKILRPGAVTADMLQKIIGSVETIQATVREEDSAISPGQHHRHYAPRTPAYRITRADWARCGPNPARFAAMLATSGKKIALITHDPAFTLPPPHETILLPANAMPYAQMLYASLRAADELNMSTLLILTPDQTDGYWAAIHDRLRRATRPFADLQGNTP